LHRTIRGRGDERNATLRCVAWYIAGVPTGVRSVGGSRSAGGGPRRQADIFTATLQLLAEKGYEHLTIEAVAERSGVNKTTIYRWWSSKAALLGAALVESPVLRFDVPDTGSLYGDLKELVESVLALLTTRPAADVAIAALSAAAHNPQLAAYGRQFFADRLAREHPVVERAVARGELPGEADAALLMDLLAGAVWVRVVLRQTPVEADFPDRVARIVAQGATYRPPPSGRPARRARGARAS
jgi:AcrR family transcriptional regulator